MEYNTNKPVTPNAASFVDCGRCFSVWIITEYVAARVLFDTPLNLAISLREAGPT
jgi:hypothetical protein